MTSINANAPSDIEKGTSVTATVVTERASAAATQMPLSKQTSGKAVASMVLGIIGLFVFGIVLGLIAICLSIGATNDIKKRPDEVDGKCLAIAGRVLGIIDVVGWAIFVIIYASSASAPSY